MYQRSPLSINLLLRDDMLSNGEHILADGADALTDKVISFIVFHFSFNHVCNCNMKGDSFFFAQLMVPYIRDPNNSPRQNTHNTIARAGIERSFALMKGKHRRHKKLPLRNHAYLIDHIYSGFVLHNFIILEGEEGEEAEVWICLWYG